MLTSQPATAAMEDFVQLHLSTQPASLPGSKYIVQQGMQRAPSLDSATHCDVPLPPIARLRGANSDSATEEDSSPLSHRRSSTRLNNLAHHGKFKIPQQHSHSLPTTPCVNGTSQNSGLKGHFPMATSYNTLPYVLPSHTLEPESQRKCNSLAYFPRRKGIKARVRNGPILRRDGRTTRQPARQQLQSPQ